MLLSKEIGRYFVALESLLWPGMTEAVFPWSGNKAMEKQSWTRPHSGLASSAEQPFRTLLGTWTGLSFVWLKASYDLFYLFWFEDSLI